MVVSAGSPDTIQQLLAGRQLIVVSNREPYVHRRSPRGTRVDRPAGGLVAALDPVVQAASGTWIAWGSGDADFDVTDAHGHVRVPPGHPRYTLRRLALSREDVDGYYYGYANQALWPLFHFITDKARFRRRFWETYQRVNRRFAQAVLEEAGANALTWIHDYHLMLCPREVRQARPDLFLMHFWHIPWPLPDVWHVCPQRAELLDGLLANDLIGFQRPRHVQAFLQCVQRELPADVNVEEAVVEYEGHVTHVRAFPISVDFAALDALAHSKACLRWMARLRSRFNLDGRMVAVGADRLDYTKGIPERLQAIDLLLSRHPEYQSRLVFIQKSAPSRTRIKAYRDLQLKVKRDIARVNAAHGTDDWQPVVHLPQPLPPAGMAALYRMADLGIVSSLQDGMNLVAKEFVACQVDQRGVLVLSELAGAQRELGAALPINPRDVEGFTAVLQRALTMPADERRLRMEQMRAYLADHDIYSWMEHHFQAAVALLNARALPRALLDHLDDLRTLVRQRAALAVLADFDGTLAPLADDPAEAHLPEDTRALLRRLAASPATLVAVLSGRALRDLRAKVGLDRVIYAGNHGLEIAGDGWEWVAEDAQAAAALIAECTRRLERRLRRIRGVILEAKGLSTSVHYRRVALGDLPAVESAVREEVDRLPAGRVRLRRGKKVIEIRPDLPSDKGTAARWILNNVFGQTWADDACVICMGDDQTDEDVFTALGDAAVTVTIGSPEQTAAHYRLSDPAEVAQVLDRLVRWRQAPGAAPAG